jgi:TolB protein
MAGLLIVAGLLLACGASDDGRSTVASSQAGQSQSDSPTSIAATETAGRWPEPDTGICEFSMPPMQSGVYVMNPDGTDVREVIGLDQAFGEDVVWSPDGRSVTYVGMTLPESAEAGITPTPDASGEIPGPTHGIFQRDIATGADTMLLSHAGVETLAWSADGTRLAFTHFEYEGSTQRHWISVVNADGSDLRRIAELPAGLHDIALSFTGEQPRLAYNFDNNLWVMNADGSGQQMLTDTLDAEYEPAWSPAGEVIFRASDGFRPDDWRDDPYLLYSVQPDGTNLRLLDPFERGDRQPSWSPDGRQIAFSRAGEIWVMKVDGSDRRNMTQHLAEDTAPLWSPDGSLILFRSLFRESPGEMDEPHRETGKPRPIALRSGNAEQEGLSVAACWNAGNSRTVGGSGGAVPFPAEPLVVDDGSATVTLDFSQLGEPQTVAVAVYDLDATRANGKGFGDAAIVRPCASPGGVEDDCLVLDTTYPPAETVDITLELPAGDYVLIVKSNVVAGSQYGYVEQAFHVRIDE